MTDSKEIENSSAKDDAGLAKIVPKIKNGFIYIKFIKNIYFSN